MELRRVWWAVTAATSSTGAGRALAMVLVRGSAVSAAANGPYQAPLARALNQLAYLTNQSNLLVFGCGLLLALDATRRSTPFRATYLTALSTITLTFVMTHTILQPGSGIGARLVHELTLLLTVAGWAMFGPRNLFSRRLILVPVSYGALYVIATLVRGAVSHWYPYNAMFNVTTRGYGPVLVSAAVQLGAFAIIAAPFVLADRLGASGPSAAGNAESVTT